MCIAWLCLAISIADHLICIIGYVSFQEFNKNHKICYCLGGAVGYHAGSLISQKLISIGPYDEIETFDTA